MSFLAKTLEGSQPCGSPLSSTVVPAVEVAKCGAGVVPVWSRLTICGAPRSGVRKVRSGLPESGDRTLAQPAGLPLDLVDDLFDEIFCSQRDS
jgi:hypothetical protein